MLIWRSVLVWGWMGILLVSSAIGQEKLETNSFHEVTEKALELGKQYGNEGVLVVLDVDSTLLSNRQALGSDYWFAWQEKLLKEGNSEHLVAKSIEGVAQVQAKIYSLSKMRPPEAETPLLLRQMQKSGFPMIVLTSRWPEFRDFTERELGLNGYQFHSSAIGPENGYPGTFLPYSEETAKEMSWPAPRNVSYMNGIFFGSGVNKGVLLRALLKKTGFFPKALIFVDDQVRHCDRVQEAFADSSIHLVTYRYGKEDSVVSDFMKSEKVKVNEQWRKLEKVLTEIFP